MIIAIDEAGLRIDAYNTINSISFYGSIILGILHGFKLKAGIIVVILSVLIERYLAGPLANAIIYVENGFVDTGKQNAVVAFVFVPLLGFVLAKVFRRSYKVMWDVMMVPPIIMFAGARIACTFAGCCRGYPFEWGIYNVKTSGNVFPIQLLESLVAIAILVFIFARERKNKFIPDGKNVPIILIFYGASRFFLEFLHNNEKIIIGLASTQFHCILMIIVGVLTLMIIRKSENKLTPINVVSSDTNKLTY